MVIMEKRLRTTTAVASSSAVAASIRDSLLLLGSAGGLVFRGSGVSTASSAEYGCGGGAERLGLLGRREELAMNDDCCEDPTMPPEKKRRLTPEQVRLLEKSIETENKLEPEKKSELAKMLGLRPQQVAVWYQNRRARWKTKQLERDFGRLKALYDALVSDHESLRADNQRLNSEAVSLTEQLKVKTTAQIPASDDHHSPPPPDEALRVGEQPPTATAPTAAAAPAEPKLNGTPIKATSGDNPLHDSGFSYLPEQHDTSVHEQLWLAAASEEEEEVSDNGGGYFQPLLSEKEAFSMDLHHLYDGDYDGVPLRRDDDGGFMGWWVWS